MSIKNAVNSIFILLSLSSVLIPLQTPAASVSDDKYEILREIKEKHKDSYSIKAAVYQDKQIAALNKPVHVEGMMVLQRPGMLRWEAFSPEKSITVIDKKTITKYYPEDKEAEIRKLADNFIASNTMRFFSSVMWGAMEEMEKRFDVDISRNSDGIVVELVPLSKIVSKYLSSVVIFYNERTGLPRGFEMVTPNGDKTVTRLADVKMNPEIGADTFKLKLPADVRVRDYTEPMDFK